CPRMPSMSGTLGPETSASSNPTLCPSFASTIARFTANVVFPTPPLPEPTAMMVSTPGRGCGPCGGCPGRGGMGELKENLSNQGIELYLDYTSVAVKLAVRRGTWSGC